MRRVGGYSFSQPPLPLGTGNDRYVGKFAIFILFEVYLDAEGVVIGAWTLYDVMEVVRRAFGNNRYVDPKVLLVPLTTGNGQILCLLGTNVWYFMDKSTWKVF